MGPAVATQPSAVPGINTVFMSLCHDTHIPTQSDIIILEYTINDGDPSWDPKTGRPMPPMDNAIRRPYERLIRKLLSYPKRPPVILLHSYAYLKPMPFVGCYWSQYERELHEFALYYELPEISVKTATYRLMQKGTPPYQAHRFRSTLNPKPGWDAVDKEADKLLKGKVFYFDVWHPDGNTGARVMAELTAQLLLDADVELRTSPFTATEKFLATQEPLPPPLLPHNYHTDGGKCLVGAKLKAQVVSTVGWAWMKTGTETVMKWGYESLLPGATMVIRFNSTSPAHGMETWEAPVSMEVWIQNYPNMGSEAVLTCTAGCTCKSTVLSMRNPLLPAAQPVLINVPVSQSDLCEVTLTPRQAPLNSSDPIQDPGFHCFKFGGLLVGEDPDDWTLDNWAALGWLRDVMHPNPFTATDLLVRPGQPMPGTPLDPVTAKAKKEAEEAFAAAVAKDPKLASLPKAAATAAGAGSGAASAQGQAGRGKAAGPKQGQGQDPAVQAAVKNVIEAANAAAATAATIAASGKAQTGGAAAVGAGSLPVASPPPPGGPDPSDSTSAPAASGSWGDAVQLATQQQGTVQPGTTSTQAAAAAAAAADIRSPEGVAVAQTAAALLATARSWGIAKMTEEEAAAATAAFRQAELKMVKEAEVLMQGAAAEGLYANSPPPPPAGSQPGAQGPRA